MSAQSLLAKWKVEKPTDEQQPTFESELKHLERSAKIRDAQGLKQLALNALSMGVVPSGTNMVGCLRMLAGNFPLLAKPFYEIAHA